jgi:WD40 repeat protein
LVPALSAGALPGSAAWRAVVVAPGRRPVDAVATLTGEKAPSRPVLLVVDQFEELWATGVDPVERTAFLDTVLGLIDDGIVVRCVAVLRGDHAGRVAEHAAFTERVGTALVLVPPFTEEEIRDVVRGPAATVGLIPESELLDAVVADVAGRPAALPLLSTALVGTWEHRRGDRLTLAGYLEAGGVAGALARSAEAVYLALDDEGRESARRLLVRLADTDEGGALVRRPLPLSELDVQEGTRRRVVDAFVARRLLAVDGAVLDVAHEALLTSWPRLARWLEDDAVGRAVRRHLAPAAHEWLRRGEPDDELFRGARLSAALDWAAEALDDLTPLEQRFLAASRARADAELTEARDRLLREKAARRRTRRLAVGLAAVLVVALVAAGAAVLSQRAAERASTVAERTSQIADANRLAALSSTAESLDLTYLLAAQGFRLRDTPETRDALLASLVEHRRVIRTLPVGGDAPLGSLADGGRTVLIGNHFTGRILSWPVDSADPPRVVLETDENWAGWRATAWSPTDAVVVAAGTGESGPWVRTVDADGAVHELLSGAEVGGEPVGVAVLPDGRRARLIVAGPGDAPLATWRVVDVDLADGTRRETGAQGTAPGPVSDLKAELSADGTVAVLVAPANRAVVSIDLTTGRQVPLESPTGDPGTFFEFRALPAGAALLGSEGTVTLYDADGRIRQQFDALPGAVIDLDVSPDGTWGVTTGAESAVVLWNIDPGTGRWSEKEVLTGAGGIVGTAMIDPSGNRLYTLSGNDMLVVWDVAPTGGFGAPRPGLGDRWIPDEPAVVAPGELVVVPTRPFGSADSGDWPYFGPGSAEVTATFIDPRTGEVVDEVEVGDTLEESITGASVAVSPDRSLIAVSSGLGVTVLDARSRDPVTRFTVPAAGYGGPDGLPLPVGVVGCVAWAADGSRLFVGVQGGDPDTSSGGGTLYAVGAASWKVTSKATVDVVPEAVALSPDGRSLALAGGRTGELEIRDAATLAARDTVDVGGGGRIWDLSWSEDGRLLLAAGEGFHMIDAATGEVGAPVIAADFGILQVEWLPDRRTVALTGVGGMVALFDVDRAVASGGLPAATENLQAATFMVPGPTEELVILSDHDWVMSYPVTPSAWLRAACRIAGRDLTRAEWDQYVPGREWQPTCTDLG